MSDTVSKPEEVAATEAVEAELRARMASGMSALDALRAMSGGSVAQTHRRRLVLRRPHRDSPHDRIFGL